MTVFTGENSQLQRAGVTLRVLRMMRIFWVIKLARHFIGLQTLGLTLKRCYREMVMLLVFICVAMAIFSALSQLLENGLDLGTKNKDYASIPAACWWVIISMTTVGYGDMCPITVPGRILGGICVVSGIVLLALPITFIYHSFVQCYHELKFRSARYSRSLSVEFLNWPNLHSVLLAKLCLRREQWKVPSRVLLDWMVLWNNILTSLEKPATIQTGRMSICLEHLARREGVMFPIWENKIKRIQKSSARPVWCSVCLPTKKAEQKNGRYTDICHSCNYILNHSKQCVAEVFQRFQHLNASQRQW